MEEQQNLEKMDLDDHTEGEAEIHVEEKQAGETTNKVETVKNSLEDQQHQENTALKGTAERWPQRAHIPRRRTMCQWLQG